MVQQTGELEVFVVQGMALKDVESFGKQDPYCIVELSGQKFKTKAKTDGGKNPVWNERFKFLNINTAYSTELTLKVYDSNTTTSDTEIGTARLPMMRVYEEKTSEHRVLLQTAKGKSAGEVAVVFTWRPYKDSAPAATTPGTAAAAAPAPAPVQYVQVAPAPAPVQYMQAAPAPAPVQYVQAAPAPAPAQHAQAPPAPAVYAQPAPAPVPFAQPPPAPAFPPYGAAPLAHMPPPAAYPSAAYPDIPGAYPPPPANAYPNVPSF